jgi:hypothetical protein
MMNQLEQASNLKPLRHAMDGASARPLKALGNMKAKTYARIAMR